MTDYRIDNLTRQLADLEAEHAALREDHRLLKMKVEELEKRCSLRDLHYRLERLKELPPPPCSGVDVLPHWLDLDDPCNELEWRMDSIEAMKRRYQRRKRL